MLNTFLFEKEWQGHGKQEQVYSWLCQLQAMMTISKFPWNNVLIGKTRRKYCIPPQAVERIKW